MDVFHKRFGYNQTKSTIMVIFFSNKKTKLCSWVNCEWQLEKNHSIFISSASFGWWKKNVQRIIFFWWNMVFCKISWQILDSNILNSILWYLAPHFLLRQTDNDINRATLEYVLIINSFYDKNRITFLIYAAPYVANKRFKRMKCQFFK
jgi:hypothetical protein